MLGAFALLWDISGGRRFQRKNNLIVARKKLETLTSGIYKENEESQESLYKVPRRIYLAERPF